MASPSRSPAAASRLHARESRALASAGHPVRLLRLVPPHVRRRCRRARCKEAGAAVKLAGEREEWDKGRAGPEPLQHCLVRYMVVGADRIDGQHGRAWVQLGSSVEELVQALGACPRARPKLVRKARFLEGTGEVLRQRTGDQPPENVANDECPQPLGLRSATMRPSRRAWRTCSGTSALAKRSAARWRSALVFFDLRSWV